MSGISVRGLACFVSFATLSVGCSPGDPWEENPACAMVCLRATECLHGAEVEEYCFSQCAGAASGAGELGQGVVDGCAACVEEADCTGILSGDCAASCPHGIFSGLVPEQPPVEEPPLGPGDRCDGLWTVGEVTYELLCARPAVGEPFVACDCYVDGIQQGSFRATDACEVDEATLADRATTGCTWPSLDGAPPS